MYNNLLCGDCEQLGQGVPASDRFGHPIARWVSCPLEIAQCCVHCLMLHSHQCLFYPAQGIRCLSDRHGKQPCLDKSNIGNNELQACIQCMKTLNPLCQKYLIHNRKQRQLDVFMKPRVKVLPNLTKNIIRGSKYCLFFHKIILTASYSVESSPVQPQRHRYRIKSADRMSPTARWDYRRGMTADCCGVSQGCQEYASFEIHLITIKF